MARVRGRASGRGLECLRGLRRFCSLAAQITNTYCLEPRVEVAVRVRVLSLRLREDSLSAAECSASPTTAKSLRF